MAKPSASLTLVLALTAAHPSAGELVEAHGVLRDIGGILPCPVLETDDGLLFDLEQHAGFEVGDRIFATGTVDPFFLTPCGSLGLPRLTDNTVEAAFAGVGTLGFDRDGAFLQTGAGTYRLADASAYPLAGTRVYAKGVVSTLPGGALRIENEILGPGFAGFGRLTFVGGWALETDRGVLSLPQIGLAFPEPGLFVYAEGVARPSMFPAGGPAAPVGILRSPVVKEAVALAGELVDDAGETLFKATGVVFEDLFRLPSTAGFAVGDPVFVRGRAPLDFDPLEANDPILVRSALLDAPVAGCGTIVDGPSVALDAGGEPILLEFAGAFGFGDRVWVAGALDGGAPTVAFEHDVIAPCAELSGTLVIGFECAPLFFADAPFGTWGDVFQLEELGGFWIGDELCVEGALAPGCGSGCPVPCLVANTAVGCP